MFTAIDEALLRTEWDSERGRCPLCDGYDPETVAAREAIQGHAPDCVMDRALAERGFPMRADRERARATLLRELHERVTASAPTVPPPATLTSGVALRMFPVLRYQPQLDGGPANVPWEMLAAHEGQALRNHDGQTLERLAERGGLCPLEMLCILDDKTWKQAGLQVHAPGPVPIEVRRKAAETLADRVRAWMTARGLAV